MKPATLWQRLNAAILALVFLILATQALWLFMQARHGEGERRVGRLDAAKFKILADELQMDRVLAMQLVDANGEIRKQRRSEAEEAERDMISQLDDLETRFSNRPELKDSARELRRVATQDLFPLDRRI